MNEQTIIPADYLEVLEEIKARIRSTQIKAAPLLWHWERNSQTTTKTWNILSSSLYIRRQLNNQVETESKSLKKIWLDYKS